MTPLEVARTYFDAWNRRDAAAIVATFSEDGSYSDPASQGELKGEAIGAYAAGLWAAFPNLSFEILSAAEAGDGIVAAQWIMRGTNSGSFAGLPPTGRHVELAGADFVKVEDGKIRSVLGYFDSAELPRQLGLQVLVQPHSIGPFRFGTSVHVTSGKGSKPGAFSITVLHALSAGEAARVQDYSRQIVQEMMAMPEFIGWIGVTVGNAMLTLTAWEDSEAPRKLLTQGAHAVAVRDFFGAGIASGGFTSVWAPARINAFWVRCASCGKMVDREKSDGGCACGAALPEAPPYL